MSREEILELGRWLALVSACLGSILVCALTLVGQILAPRFYQLEAMLSLTPQLVAVSVLIAIAAAKWHPRLSGGAAIFAALAILPFALFSKFESPSNKTCQPAECLTVLTINMWGESELLPALSEQVLTQKVDVLAINESTELTAERASEEEFFPGFDSNLHANWLTMPQGMSNPVSLMSRLPLARAEKVVPRGSGGRAYIFADLDGPWSGIRVVTAHARTPTSRSRHAQRNTLLGVVSDVATESESFILMGDFNLTAWSPTFRSLPGKRAGNPRFQMTWPTEFPPLGIAIDHIMFSEDLELVDVQVLDSIGSDHLPVLARFRRKTDG